MFYNPPRCLCLATFAPEMGREFVPDRIASSRGIGLLVDTSKDVYVRRHAVSMFVITSHYDQTFQTMVLLSQTYDHNYSDP